MYFRFCVYFVHTHAEVVFEQYSEVFGGVEALSILILPINLHSIQCNCVKSLQATEIQNLTFCLTKTSKTKSTIAIAIAS